MKIKEISRMALCLLFVLSIVFAVPATGADEMEDANRRYNELEEQLKQTQQAYRDTQRKKEGDEASLKLLQAESDNLEKQLVILTEKNDSLNGKISDTNLEIQKLSAQIQNVNRQISQNTQRKTQLEVEIDQTTDLLAQRLRANYMAGSTSWLEIFINVGSVQDYLTRTELFARLVESDRLLIESLDEQAQELSNLNQSLEKDKEEIVSAENQETAAKSLLVSQQTELKESMAQLSVKQKEIQTNWSRTLESMKSLDKNSDALKVQEARINAEMEQAEVEIARIIAERKRIEEERTRTTTTQTPSVAVTTGEGATAGTKAPTTTSTTANNSSDSKKMGYPLEQKASITSYFGPRKNPFGAGSNYHTGIDFAVGMGTPVIATGDGTVIVARVGFIGYGTYVLIDHGGGLFTLYAHGSSVLVNSGAKVVKGQRIMLSGSSGRSTGPHLHYEVRVPNSAGVSVAVDPLNGYL